MTESPLDSQLAGIVRELDAARTRAHDLAESLDAADWKRRPAPGRWSVAECLAHLNLTSRTYVPIFEEAIARGEQQQLRGPGPFRRDLPGWLLCTLLEPPVRLVKVKTPPPFVPSAEEGRERTLAEFDVLQQQMAAFVERANGLALDRIKIVSPFDSRAKYNLYSAFRIIPTHQRRHLWQAERVRAALQGR